MVGCRFELNNLRKLLVQARVLSSIGSRRVVERLPDPYILCCSTNIRYAHSGRHFPSTTDSRLS